MNVTNCETNKQEHGLFCLDLCCKQHSKTPNERDPLCSWSNADHYLTSRNQKNRIEGPILLFHANVFKKHSNSLQVNIIHAAPHCEVQTRSSGRCPGGSPRATQIVSSAPRAVGPTWRQHPRPVRQDLCQTNLIAKTSARRGKPDSYFRTAESI